MLPQPSQCFAPDSARSMRSRTLGKSRSQIANQAGESRASRKILVHEIDPHDDSECSWPDPFLMSKELSSLLPGVSTQGDPVVYSKLGDEGTIFEGAVYELPYVEEPLQPYVLYVLEPIEFLPFSRRFFILVPSEDIAAQKDQFILMATDKFPDQPILFDLVPVRSILYDKDAQDASLSLKDSFFDYVSFCPELISNILVSKGQASSEPSPNQEVAYERMPCLPRDSAVSSHVMRSRTLPPQSLRSLKSQADQLEECDFVLNSQMAREQIFRDKRGDKCPTKGKSIIELASHPRKSIHHSRDLPNSYYNRREILNRNQIPSNTANENQMYEDLQKCNFPAYYPFDQYLYIGESSQAPAKVQERYAFSGSAKPTGLYPVRDMSKKQSEHLIAKGEHRVPSIRGQHPGQSDFIQATPNERKIIKFTSNKEANNLVDFKENVEKEDHYIFSKPNLILLKEEAYPTQDASQLEVDTISIPGTLREFAERSPSDRRTRFGRITYSTIIPKVPMTFMSAQQRSALIPKRRARGSKGSKGSPTEKGSAETIIKPSPEKERHQAESLENPEATSLISKAEAESSMSKGQAKVEEKNLITEVNPSLPKKVKVKSQENIIPNGIEDRPPDEACELNIRSLEKDVSVYGIVKEKSENKEEIYEEIPIVTEKIDQESRIILFESFSSSEDNDSFIFSSKSNEPFSEDLIKEFDSMMSKAINEIQEGGEKVKDNLASRMTFTIDGSFEDAIEFQNNKSFGNVNKKEALAMERKNLGAKKKTKSKLGDNFSHARGTKCDIECISLISERRNEVSVYEIRPQILKANSQSLPLKINLRNQLPLKQTAIQCNLQNSEKEKDPPESLHYMLMSKNENATGQTLFLLGVDDKDEKQEIYKFTPSKNITVETIVKSLELGKPISIDPIPDKAEAFFQSLCQEAMTIGTKPATKQLTDRAKKSKVNVSKDSNSKLSVSSSAEFVVNVCKPVRMGKKSDDAAKPNQQQKAREKTKNKEKTIEEGPSLIEEMTKEVQKKNKDEIDLAKFLSPELILLDENPLKQVQDQNSKLVYSEDPLLRRLACSNGPLSEDLVGAKNILKDSKNEKVTYMKGIEQQSTKKSIKESSGASSEKEVAQTNLEAYRSEQGTASRSLENQESLSPSSLSRSSSGSLLSSSTASSFSS